jgi:hypothetical protein
MRHRASFAAATLVLCGSAFAQLPVDPSRIYPVTAPMQVHPPFDMNTGTWLAQPPSGSQFAGPLTVYNNTCINQNFFFGLQPCEDMYDSGRIPSTGDPLAPPAATDDNRINLVEFNYCTTAQTGTVDIKLGFWDNLVPGGTCFSGMAPTPPSIATQATAYFDFGAAAGFPLPGSATAGMQSCHVVPIIPPGSGFCLLSDGDGIFDNNPPTDLFTWSFQHENTGTTTGPLIRGHPNQVPPGNCTYTNPCTTACGTGLGSEDRFWVNVDGVAVGNSTSGLCPGGVAGPCATCGGTGCYFFGGYPTNVYASFYLRLESSGSCTACTGNVTIYCTAKTNSSGCVPAINTSGLSAPSASLGSGFVVGATNILNAKFGLLFYSKTAAASSPFQGGLLCAQPPLVRTAVQNSAGTAPCGGTFALDFNAYIASGKDPALVSGQQVWAQYWSRDPGFAPPDNTNLTNAVNFVICQ